MCHARFVANLLVNSQHLLRDKTLYNNCFVVAKATNIKKLVQHSVSKKDRLPVKIYAFQQPVRFATDFKCLVKTETQTERGQYYVWKNIEMKLNAIMMVTEMKWNVPTVCSLYMVACKLLNLALLYEMPCQITMTNLTFRSTSQRAISTTHITRARLDVSLPLKKLLNNIKLGSCADKIVR